MASKGVVMRVEQELKLGFKDVLIRPKRSTIQSRKEVVLNRTYEFKHSKASWSGVPIIAANMDTVGTFPMAAALAKHEILTALHKHFTPIEWQNAVAAANPSQWVPKVMVSVGGAESELARLTEVMELEPQIQFICIDVANGYTQSFTQQISRIRELFPRKTIVAGNVVTGEMTEELILCGADAVKVGIGPGSVCTTRVKTGIGYPQLSAIIECADAAHGLSGHIVADGGCTCPGDIVKAFGAGADFVMLGGMLAGHAESGGEIIETNGKKFVEFYGMSSQTAMEKHVGGVAEYRASEGKTVRIPYRGSVDATVQEILGGLRSACTYVGARRLKELSKRTTFIRVREQENQVFS